MNNRQLIAVLFGLGLIVAGLWSGLSEVKPSTGTYSCGTPFAPKEDFLCETDSRRTRAFVFIGAGVLVGVAGALVLREERPGD